jgi:hypothetical protein
MGRKNNSLTDMKIAALYSWLDKERDWCSDATAQQCAVRAADQLGFGVTASNILTAKRNLNIVKPAPVAPAAVCRCKELAAIVYSLFRENRMQIGSSIEHDNLRELAGISPKPATKPTPNAPALPGIGEGAAA